MEERSGRTPARSAAAFRASTWRGCCWAPSRRPTSQRGWRWLTRCAAPAPRRGARARTAATGGAAGRRRAGPRLALRGGWRRRAAAGPTRWARGSARAASAAAWRPSTASASLPVVHLSQWFPRPTTYWATGRRGAAAAWRAAPGDSRCARSRWAARRRSSRRRRRRRGTAPTRALPAHWPAGLAAKATVRANSRRRRRCAARSAATCWPRPDTRHWSPRRPSACRTRFRSPPRLKSGIDFLTTIVLCFHCLLQCPQQDQHYASFH